MTHEAAYREQKRIDEMERLRARVAELERERDEAEDLAAERGEHTCVAARDALRRAEAAEAFINTMDKEVHLAGYISEDTWDDMRRAALEGE